MIALPEDTRITLADGMVLQLTHMYAPYPTPPGVQHWHDATGRPYVDAPAFRCRTASGATGEAWVEPEAGADGQRHLLLSQGPGTPAAYSAALSAGQLQELTGIYQRTLSAPTPATPTPAATPAMPAAPASAQQLPVA